MPTGKIKYSLLLSSLNKFVPSKYSLVSLSTDQRSVIRMVGEGVVGCLMVAYFYPREYSHCFFIRRTMILMGKRELVVWPSLAVPWACLRFVIVVFPDHTHILF